MGAVRGPVLNAERQTSADFIEFIGLSGLGQAEMESINRANIDLQAGRIVAYRHKTSKDSSSQSTRSCGLLLNGFAPRRRMISAFPDS